MSDDDAKKLREEVVEDAKQRYRLTSIEEDGDDPAKPFKKIGGGDGDGDGDGGDDDGGGDLGGLGGGGSHGGGGGGGLGDLGDLGDLDDLEGGEPGDEEGGEEDTGEEKPDKKLKEVTDPEKEKEENRERDQSGRHKYDVRREDPLGANLRYPDKKKNSEGKPVSAIRHNYEHGSPLMRELQKPTVDKGMITSLSEFLHKTNKDTKQEILTENMKNNPNGRKSMMDETNILSND